MSSTRPQITVFVDVDGTLAPVTDTAPPGTWPDWEHIGDYGYPVHLSATMCQRIRQLGQITWLTAWRHHADTIIGPRVGWNQRPVLTEADLKHQLAPAHLSSPTKTTRPATTPRTRGWGWKVDALLHWMAAEPGPFIWLDDDLGTVDGLTDILDQTAQPYLLITPDTSTGLTDTDLTRAETWVQNLQARETHRNR